jgi:hypothetical protein
MQGTGESVSRRCPRCGGVMTKPPGSSLFWHADYNHPRCDITNIVDSPETLPVQPESVEEQAPGKDRRHRGK